LALRVGINAVHAKTGGGLSYLRSMLPLIAAAPDVAARLFAADDTVAALAPIDARIELCRVRPWRGWAGLLAWEQIVLPRLLRRDRIDVTFSPANFTPLLAPSPVVLLGTATGMIVRERRLHMRVYWAVLTAMTWLSLLVCRRAAAVSAFVRDNLTPGPMRALRSRVTVVHHGVGAEFRADNGPREAFLLAVADLYPQKNLHRLIEAFAALATARPDLTLRIAGRPIDESYAAELAAQVARLGLAGRIAFLGGVPREELAALYRRCAVFVFPSTVESFGMPLLEAMASAAPIACARAAAMPEVLGEAGLYFDPDDAAGMARAIAILLDDESRRRDLAAQGLARAALFSWDAAAASTLTVLRAAAGKDSHVA
jgi:glycosyltransferase involved in cell wall biosynthesis